jgi:hypothetical protein
MRNVRHIFRKTAQLLEDFDSMKTAIRALTRAAAFTSVIVLTLGISAAANLAVFSVVDAMLLKAMPYASAERIVLPWRHLPPGMSLGYSEIPWGEFEVAAFQSRPQTFEHVGAFKSAQFNLGDGIERLDGIRASAGFFRVLGTAPLLGRVYDAEDDRAGHQHGQHFAAPIAGVFDIVSLLPKDVPALDGSLGLDIFAGRVLTIEPRA